MKKYKIWVHMDFGVEVEVKANDESEALEKADELACNLPLNQLQFGGSESDIISEEEISEEELNNKKIDSNKDYIVTYSYCKKERNWKVIVRDEESIEVEIVNCYDENEAFNTARRLAKEYTALRISKLK